MNHDPGDRLARGVKASQAFGALPSAPGVKVGKSSSSFLVSPVSLTTSLPPSKPSAFGFPDYLASTQPTASSLATHQSQAPEAPYKFLPFAAFLIEPLRAATRH
jgi:hypothetical protein